MSWLDESLWEPVPRIEDGTSDDDHERELRERNMKLSADLAEIGEAHLGYGTVTLESSVQGIKHQLVGYLSRGSASDIAFPWS